MLTPKNTMSVKTWRTMALQQTRSKYGNKKTTVDGVTFDSAWEAEVWSVLKLMEKAGKIHGLERQQRIDLFVGKSLICVYVADFTYFDSETGEYIVADAKGMETDVFKIKAKLFQAIMGFPITRITKPCKPSRE